MIDDIILVKARSELARLNGELHQLHLEEERAKLKRSRLEGDKARVQTLVDLCELAQRLAGKPLEQVGPSFHIEECHGAKFVVVDKPAPTPLPDAERKPEGSPTITKMVLAILEAADTGMRTRDITKVARRQWRPTLRHAAVSNVVWKLTSQGQLEKDGRLYRLNGHGGIR